MIHRLYVHNFRCLENFELQLAGRPSVLLIGRNGCGKSTVGHALEVLQRLARGTNQVARLFSPEDFSRGRSDVPIRLEIEAELGKTAYRYELALELPSGVRDLQVAEERLAVDGRPVFARDRAQIELLTPPPGRSSAFGEPSARFRFDARQIALPVIASNEPFLTWLERLVILAPIPGRIEGVSQGDSWPGGDLRPDRAAANLGDWFTGLLAHSPAAYSDIVEHLKEVMPDLKEVTNPLVAERVRRIVVEFEQEGASLKLPFSRLSDGEKCFFLSAVLLAAYRSYGPLVCFWDEPDSHLSISEVGQFVMALRRSARSHGQLLATSHNPEAIRQFSRENTFVLHRHSHLEPTIGRLLDKVHVPGDLVDALIRDEVGT